MTIVEQLAVWLWAAQFCRLRTPQRLQARGRGGGVEVAYGVRPCRLHALCHAVPAVGGRAAALAGQGGAAPAACTPAATRAGPALPSCLPALTMPSKPLTLPYVQNLPEVKGCVAKLRMEGACWLQVMKSYWDRLLSCLSRGCACWLLLVCMLLTWT